LTFMIEDAYLAFDRWVGVPNLAWLITYLVFPLAIYLLTAGCLLVLEQPRPRLMTPSLWVTMVLLCVVYAWGIVTLPEKPEHTVPETLAEFIFMQTVYVYIAVFCIIPLLTFTRLYRREQMLPAKLRWLVACGTAVVSLWVALMKVTLTALIYWDVTTLALPILYPLIGIGIGLAGVLWPLAFLPNEFYLKATRPIEFLDKVRTLQELKKLQRALNRLCPSVIGDSPSLWRSLDNLDFHLYRTLISILDAKKMLSGYAQATNGLAVSPLAVPGLRRQHSVVWDERDLAHARLLHNTLQAVDDEADYPDLLRAYRRVSRGRPAPQTDERLIWQENVS
jgi:hypothetical protein